MRKISDVELMDLYLDTLNKCGILLINDSNENIGYYFFEEFDIGATSFLHIDSLERLYSVGLINKEVKEKSMVLRSMFFNLQKSDKWNVDSVRNEVEWRNVLELSDEIKRLLSV